MEWRAVRAQIKADHARYLVGADGFSLRHYARDVLLKPGLLCCLLLRLQGLLVSKGHSRLGDLLRTLNLAITGADILSGANIGGGLLLQHPTGIVVGHGSTIGANCTLLQHVTVGERYVRGRGDHGYPVLEDDVVVGAGAYILGSVRVGHGAMIGAKALVLDDVPAGAVVVGTPARVIRQDGNPNHNGSDL